MDMEVLFHTIMTDPKGSKSNIAARFQNAFALQVSPPIGVFWDIENCQVPKGKSAITLVQNIREKFFEHHREAEFMCVCDIHKESKIVIQELLFAQVTVVHISAISKNAADDKLKQCMKRFVDTHGSPATLLLISDDVNFASDLSDFRHRHNIRIILIHRGHAHQSLLTCAHEHHNFFTITQDLPIRSPVKSANNRPWELDVTNLPTNRKESYIKNYLQKLSSNCGGKVICIRGSRAIIRFANADTAEKAKKRMDKELVFGNKISVNFRARTAIEFSYSPPRDYIRDFISSPESSVTHSPCSSRDSSPSPPPTNRAKLTNYMCNVASEKKFDFPPPPVINDQNHPSLLWRGKPQNCIDNSKSFSTANNSDLPKGRKAVSMGWNNIKAFCQTTDKYQDSAFSPFKKDPDTELKKYPQRSVGRVAPFVAPECDMKNVPGHLNEYSSNRRNPANSNSYPMYPSQGFLLFPQNISLPGNERINDSAACTSQWGGAALHGDSGQSVSRCSIPPDVSAPVELHVSNLDSKFEVNEMKKILLSVFSEHVMVLHISMSLQPDGSAKATVKVPSLQDAQYAISRFHRRQIGHKRILISHVAAEKNPPFHVLKSETVSLLNDIPSKNLPLIKFRELYEKRYHRPIAVSELYKMRDAVSIQGDSGSRLVYLNTDYCKTPSLPDSEDSQEFNVIERPYCERHFHVSDSQGWAEQYSICPLPIVCISLKTLSTAVHMLLDSHQGSLPLISFCDCYEAEIGSLPVIGCVKSSASQDGEMSVDPGAGDVVLTKDQKGVPLEHLIACVAGVEVANSALCIKKVQWLENKIADSQILQNCSPALASQLSLFGREVMDLLKSQSHCLVAFNKFIPTYHHHFGRQCRVADYGFTKLIDLLEAIPHIVQVLGEGQNRQVTLTHRTQVKRFSAELLRILKSRASKQITIPEFPQVYEQVVEKPFDITNYGVCEIEDMLDEVPESIIGICKTETEVVIGIPKREQTAEEIERTKQFAAEVIELMKHTPYCIMSFSKFIPSYHHHFGKQCRVADYGFTKLIELFEAIPDILEVKGTGEEKILNLVRKEQHGILTDRLVSILKSQPNEVIDINQISSVYAQMHGHALRSLDFGFTDLLELLESMDATLRELIVEKLSEKNALNIYTRGDFFIKKNWLLFFQGNSTRAVVTISIIPDNCIVIGYGRTYVTLVDHGVVHQISLNLCRLLMETRDCSMPVKDLSKLYQPRFGQKINLSLHLQDMASLIQMKGDFIRLTPLLVLARDIILLLQDHEGQVSFANFGSLFQQKYGVSICTSSYGYPNMYAMLESLSDYFSLKGKKQKRLVCLNIESIGGSLPQLESDNATSNGSHNQQMNSDILNYPIPSSVPSPNLEPRMTKSLGNLMSFETSHIQVNGCLPGEIFNCAKRLLKKESMTEGSAYTISPRESHQLPDCSSGIPSTSAAYFEQQMYISSDAQNLQSEQSCSVRSPTVIEAQHSAYIACPSNQGASFEPRSPVEKPKILKEYSLSTQSLQISKEELGCEDMNVVVLRENYSSSQSTPTQSSQQRARRNRVAARFDTPFD